MRLTQWKGVRPGDMFTVWLPTILISRAGKIRQHRGILVSTKGRMIAFLNLMSSGEVTNLAWVRAFLRLYPCHVCAQE